MRVAYVLGTSTGGTVRHVRMLADGLASRGVTVDVYAPAATWASDAPARPGAREPDATFAAGGVPAVRETTESVTGAEAGGEADRAAAKGAVKAGGGRAPRFTAVEIADRPRPAQDLAAVRRLRTLLAGTRPDAVHAHGLRAGALAALAAGRGRGRPRLIVTVHNAAPPGGAAAAVYRILEWLVTRRADQVLCVSSDLEARMRKLGARNVTRALVPAPPASGPPPDQAAIARLRAELGARRPDAGSGRVPIVLAVARLAPQKGLETLVEAARQWRDRVPAPLLVFAGDGPLREGLAGQAQAAGIPVRFLGQRADVPALLAAADVVVLPSVWEGQPLIVQETLRAGRPLVASLVGGIPDLTGPDAALLVPPGDPAALAAAVLSVLDDPALAARLGEAAVKHAALLPSEQDAIDAASGWITL